MTENQILLALEEKIITELEATTLWIYSNSFPTYSINGSLN